MIRYIKEKIAYIEERLKDRLFTFRLLAVVLCLDFIAFVSLSNFNPLQMLNPLKFLQANPTDKRGHAKMWFPRTINLQGLLPSDAATKAATTPEKAEFLPEQHVLLVEKKIASRDKYKPDFAPTNADIARANLLLHELILGPGEGKEALKASGFIKDREFIKYIWQQNDTIIIHARENTWKQLTDLEKKIADYCITKTITENIPTAKNVRLVFSE